MEKELFRDHLERLRELYPGKEVITIAETCALLHINRHTLLQDKKCPAKQIGGRYVVPLINLARYMS